VKELQLDWYSLNMGVNRHRMDYERKVTDEFIIAAQCPRFDQYVAIQIRVCWILTGVGGMGATVQHNCRTNAKHSGKFRYYFKESG